MDELVIQLGQGLGLQDAIGPFAPICAGMLNIIPMILAVFFYDGKTKAYNTAATERNHPGYQPEPDYDFIIVGAGNAGSVLANRLSEHFRTLLIDHGGEPNPLTLVPGLQSSFVSRPETDHSYLTEPQNSSCLAMYNEQCVLKSAAVLGGSTYLNSMIYIRPTPSDMDSWARITKDDRWSYKNILPFFLKSEGYCGTCDPSEGVKPTIDPLYHNSKGELPVRPPSHTPTVKEFLEAQKWTGVDRGDLNAPYYKEIADVILSTTNRGKRVSAYQAFVEPLIGNRPKLTVINHASITEILFKDHTNRATGVKYERFGKVEVAKARKEVILSAGTIATPQLLLLSGIGPAEDLKKLGIPVRSNVPVGKNLQYHIGTSLVGPFTMDNPPPHLKAAVLDESQVEKFLKEGTGPFATSLRTQAQAQWLSSIGKPNNYLNNSQGPDLQLFSTFTKLDSSVVDGYVQNANMKREILAAYLEPLFGQDTFSFTVTATRPSSRGYLKLRSKNIKDDPIIDPQTLQDPRLEDIKVLVEAIKRAVHLVENAPTYKKIGAKLSPIPFPPCKDLKFRSEEYWECFVRQTATPQDDYVGTVAMGPVGTPEAVVDPELRVIGIPGLRVIDASIMPKIVSVDTNIGTIMIGERGAEFITADYIITKSD